MSERCKAFNCRSGEACDLEPGHVGYHVHRLPGGLAWWEGDRAAASAPLRVTNIDWTNKVVTLSAGGRA